MQSIQSKKQEVRMQTGQIVFLMVFDNFFYVVNPQFYNRIIEMHKNKNSLLQELTQKQLKQDFQVYQYLRQNKEKNQNIQNYIKFYNEILLRKTYKQQRVKLFLHNYEKFKQDVTDSQPQHKIQSPLKSKYQIQLDKIWMKATQQLEIRDNLERQMIQYKKSLGLLKGDIGHIIQRNQSQNLLQSKINKVKIVADDQFNKVYHQFGKDKEEQKILSMMQKGFNLRLRNLENFEHKSLAKAEETFLEVSSKQKKMNEKLVNIQKNCALVEEYVQLKKQKIYNNYNIQYISVLLKSLQEMVYSPDSQYISKFDQKSHQIAQLNLSLSNLLQIKKNIIEVLNQWQKDKTSHEMISVSNLNEEIKSCDRIIYKYDNLLLKLESLSHHYSQQLLKIKGLKKTLEESNRTTEDYQEGFQNLNIEQKKLVYQIRDYRGRIQKNLKIIFLCLNFINQICHFERNNNLFEQTIEQISKNYENQIQYKSYYELLPQNIKNHLIHFKQAFKSKLVNLNRRSSSKLKNKYNKQNLQFLSSLQNPNQQQQEAVEIIQRINKNDQSKSVIHESNLQLYKAKRIQFLQTIDQDYYKMLKQTLKMQKDHTRKNYDFLRRFKRTKYVNRDNILKQKRFQASFSVLWSQHQKKSSPNILKSKSNCKTNTSSFRHLFRNSEYNPEPQQQQKIKQKKSLMSRTNPSSFHKKYRTILEIINKA